MNYKNYINELKNTHESDDSEIDKKLIAFIREQSNHIGIKVVNSLAYTSINDLERNSNAFRKFLSVLFSLDENKVRSILEFTDPKRKLYNKCISFHIYNGLPFSDLQYFFDRVIQFAPKTLPKLCANPVFFNGINNDNKVNMGSLLYQLINSNCSLGGEIMNIMYGKNHKSVWYVVRSGREYIRTIHEDNDPTYQKAILEYIKTLPPQDQRDIIKKEIRKETTLNFYMKLGKNENQIQELCSIIETMDNLAKTQCKGLKKAEAKEEVKSQPQFPGSRFFKQLFHKRNQVPYQQLPTEASLQM